MEPHTWLVGSIQLVAGKDGTGHLCRADRFCSRRICFRHSADTDARRGDDTVSDNTVSDDTGGNGSGHAAANGALKSADMQTSKLGAVLT